MLLKSLVISHRIQRIDGEWSNACMRLVNIYFVEICVLLRSSWMRSVSTRDESKRFWLPGPHAARSTHCAIDNV